MNEITPEHCGKGRRCSKIKCADFHFFQNVWLFIGKLYKLTLIIQFIKQKHWSVAKLGFLTPTAKSPHPMPATCDFIPQPTSQKIKYQFLPRQEKYIYHFQFISFLIFLYLSSFLLCLSPYLSFSFLPLHKYLIAFIIYMLNGKDMIWA